MAYQIALSHVYQDCWVLLTPDLDYYEEQMSLSNPDYTDFRCLGTSGIIPADIVPNAVYGFGDSSTAGTDRCNGSWG